MKTCFQVFVISAVVFLKKYVFCIFTLYEILGWYLVLFTFSEKFINILHYLLAFFIFFFTRVFIGEVDAFSGMLRLRSA